jgi:hypothetical protein
MAEVPSVRMRLSASDSDCNAHSLSHSSYSDGRVGRDFWIARGRFVRFADFICRIVARTEG